MIYRFPYLPSDRRRGSVFILVLSVLVVLALLLLTLSFTTKVELMASRNWANTVQSKMASVSGIPAFSPAVASQPAASPALAASPLLADQNLALAANAGTAAAIDDPAALLEESFADLSASPINLRLSLMSPRQLSRAAQLPGSLQSVASPGAKSTRTALANESLTDYLIEDESAKININAIVPRSLNRRATAGAGEFAAGSGLIPVDGYMDQNSLALFIQQVFDARQVHDVNPQTLAQAIVNRRLGADGKPGQASLDDNTQVMANELARVAQSQKQFTGGKTASSEIYYQNDLNEQSLARIETAGETALFDGLDNNGDGVVDDPAETIDDPSELVGDPRLSAMGDDHYFTSVEELLGLPGMTLPAYRALAPYLTVFSVSAAAYASDEMGTQPQAKQLSGVAQIDPNTATTEQLYAVLRQRFPLASADLLGHFVLNIIDQRDQDDVPSQAIFDGVPCSGSERIVYINEVCPEVWPNTEADDDGQFIELVNPYSTPINLSGLMLLGAGEPIALSGALDAQEYLVITDDIDNTNDQKKNDDPDAAEQSSFVLRHYPGGMPLGLRRGIIEQQAMNIPNNSGKIQLVAADGAVLDAFEYRNNVWSGTARSFQRQDCRLPSTTLQKSTPITANASVEEFPSRAQYNPSAATSATQSPMLDAFRIQSERQNQPFRSPLDLMLVSSAYASPSGETSTSGANEDHAWALPQLSAGNQDALDLRLIDCFRIGSGQTAEALKSDGQPAPEMASPQPNASAQTNLNTQQIQLPQVDVNYGLINLNTASPAVISSLPGVDAGLLERIMLARQEWAGQQTTFSGKVSTATNQPEYWKSQSPLTASRWNNFSEFLSDDTLWQGMSLYERLAAADPFCQLVTFHSLAYRVVTTNRYANSQSDSITQRPSIARAERIVTGDRGVIETVTFRYLLDAVNGDQDLRSARPGTPLQVAGTSTNQK